MPLKISSEQELIRQSQAYVRSELPKLDPSTEKANFITGIVVALAKMVSHFLLALKDFADRQVHPQTATGSVLYRGWWTALTGLQRTPTTAAGGYVILPGADGVIVPLGTSFSYGNNSYTTGESITVIEHSVRASSLTYDEVTGKAIFETPEPHYLATGLTIAITGASDADFNGTVEITVTADNEFTYEPTSAPVGVAGADAVATSTHALLFVTSGEGGQSVNVDGGAITIDDAIVDADSEALITFGGIAGGSDLEEQDDFRERLLEALGSTLGTFTGDEVRDVVKNIAGVTRVWVRKAKIDPEDGWPLEGQCKILFMRDNDANPVPSAQEILNVKQTIIDQIMPCHTDGDDVIVIAPTLVPVDIQISSLVPDTASMRLAVTASLKQYFEENASLAADIPIAEHSDLTLLDIKCAIKHAVDLETGLAVRSFTLDTPANDIDLGMDDLPSLGQVNFV